MNSIFLPPLTVKPSFHSTEDLVEIAPTSIHSLATSVSYMIESPYFRLNFFLAKTVELLATEILEVPVSSSRP